MIALCLLIYILLTIPGQVTSYGDLAKKMCAEYSTAVYQSVDNPTLSTGRGKSTVSTCGFNTVPLIVGGTDAALREFPHMAVIGYGPTLDAELSWLCGGSLISEVYILTAAHCLSSRTQGEAQMVQLGGITLNSPPMEKRRIAQTIAHPYYDASRKLNDIALFRMDGKVVFTPELRPACLQTNAISVNTTALASGFGKLKYESETGSDKLMKVTLLIYKTTECFKNSEDNLNNNSVICAGYLSGGKDTCQGDSGGPLQIVLEEPYCMYSIIGITSVGKFCGFANSLAIYTKIEHYVPWIESIVWIR